MQKTAMPSATRNGVAIDARIIASFNDAVSDRPAARVEGVVHEGLEQIADCQLAVVDDDNRIVGIAQFSFIDGEPGVMRLHRRPKRGFDAYIRDYRPIALIGSPRYRRPRVNFSPRHPSRPRAKFSGHYKFPAVLSAQREPAEPTFQRS